MVDQFFTKREIVQRCIQNFHREISSFEVFDNIIEPSAGNGGWLEYLPVKTIALDLEPLHPTIIKQDFFHFPFTNICNQKNLVIGNPPFGKRSKLSIEFFQYASLFADCIAFIVPNQWNKNSVQDKIPSEWRLVFKEALPENSFYTPSDERDFSCRCVFQVWEKNSNKQDLRKEKSIIKHPDFQMYLYNNTKTALKMFEENFDFAVPRQGYQDYSRRETDKDKCEKNKQWMLIKAKNKEIYERLYNLDYYQISKKNTTIPGWGKADLLEEYNEKYGITSYRRYLRIY